MRIPALLSTLVLMFALLAIPAQAQNGDVVPPHEEGVATDGPNIKVGPRITADVGDISGTAIGANLRLYGDTFPIQGSGSFDLYIGDVEGTVFTVDLNAQLPIEVERWFTPYIGAGLGLTRIENETTLGVNGLVGAEIDLRVVTPFLQSQLTLGDTDRIGLTGGLLINI